MPRSARAHRPALQARKQDMVRGAIWDAAIDLFSETSFDDTTVEDIAAAAGVSTRTFFRYFASKNDLMGQGMVRYQQLLSETIHGAPKMLPALQVVRHTVRHVAVEAASQPRVRQIMDIASTSASAREAQLSRRAEVEDVVTAAFAARFRPKAGSEIAPRLLTGLTLSILDVTFRAWSKHADADIDAIADEVFDALAALTSERPKIVRRT